MYLFLKNGLFLYIRKYKIFYVKIFSLPIYCHFWILPAQ